MRKAAVLMTVVAVLMGVLVSGCSPKSGEQKTEQTGNIVIAVVGPMTGDNAQYGKFMRNSVELAADLINKEGGINKKTVKIKVEDDKMEPQQASVVAQKLVLDKEVVAVVGHFSSTTTLAAVPVYTQGSLAVVSPSSTSPKLSGASPYFFRTCITDEPNGTAGAEYVVGKIGAKKIVIMHALSDGPTAYTRSFQKKAEELGAQILAVLPHEENAKDFTAELTKIKELKPDIIVFPGWYTQAALTGKQAAEMKLGIPVFGHDGVYADELMQIGGSAVEGFYAGAFFHPDLPNPAARKFVEAYKAKYNELPEAYGAMAYDALNVIAEAVAKVGTDRKAVRDYMEGIGSSNPAHNGVTGPVKFDSKHDVIKPVVFVQVKGGKWALAPNQSF